MWRCITLHTPTTPGSTTLAVDSWGPFCVRWTWLSSSDDDEDAGGDGDDDDDNDDDDDDDDK